MSELPPGFITDMYSRVIQLLGRSIDDSLCSRFVRDIGYEPKFNGTYLFAKSGLVLMHHKRILVAAFFQVDVDDAQNWLEPYRGDLPFDINWRDGRAEVALKLGVPAVQFEQTPIEQIEHSQMTMDTYALPPVLMTFSFGPKRLSPDLLDSTEAPAMIAPITSLIARLDDEHLPDACKEVDDERPENCLTLFTRRRRPPVEFRKRHRG